MGERIMRITAARQLDVDSIYKFGKTFYAQTKYAEAGIEYDYDTVTEVIRTCIKDGVALLAEADGQIVGMILVLVFPFLMNAEHLAATEWVFYTDPKYRKQGVGEDLLARAESILKIRGVTLFNMVNLENVTPEKAKSLYDKAGFTLAETTYIKDIQ
jgi:GNAT superfamily N-acetyltransferase